MKDPGKRPLDPIEQERYDLLVAERGLILTEDEFRRQMVSMLSLWVHEASVLPMRDPRREVWRTCAGNLRELLIRYPNQGEREHAPNHRD